MAQQDFSVAGNLRVVGSTVVYGQVAIGGSSLNLATFATDMIGNVNAANARVNAANAAITSTNSSMKTYVDSTVSSAVIAASGYGNTIVAAYLPQNPTITSIQANITAANANISSVQSNIIAANLNISSIQANVIASNIRASATDSNVSYLQSVAQYMTANILSNGAVIASNVYTNNGNFVGGTGNLIIGNVNASGNIVMTGTDATTIRFVRSVDADVTTGEIYGNIEWAGEDSTTGLNDCDLAVNVWGDSMYPKYCSGEIVVCKSVPMDKELTCVRFGEAYVVMCDDGPVVKYIKRGKDEKHLCFESENNHYEAYQVSKMPPVRGTKIAETQY